MAGEGQVLREVSWREAFAWVHLFRSFRIAIHPSKLALAWVLLLCLYGGGRIMDWAWTVAAPRYVPAQVERIDRYLVPGSGEVTEVDVLHLEREGIFIKFFKYEAGQVAQVAGGVLRWDWTGPDGVLAGTANFVFYGPAWLYRTHPVFGAIYTAWFILIWAVFGGAVARIAAVHVARDEKMSVRQAIRFSSGKMLSFIFAPIIPLLIILVLGVVLAAAGWILLHIPWVGPIILGVFFFLGLLIGGVMTLVVLGTAGGFNLMYPTIAVEGSDSFDAISRSFSYVYARPWRMLWYTVVAVAYGALCYLFVRFFIFLTLALTHWFVAWWLTGKPAQFWPVIWHPVEFWSLSFPVNFGDLKFSDAVASWFVAFWVYCVIALLGAFVISFYFSANTIIYALLRREVDATDLDDVYVEETEEEFSEAPPVAPDKINGPGAVAMTAGPLSGPAVMPPSGGEPRGATGAVTGGVGTTGERLEREERIIAPGDTPVGQEGPDKAGPTASTPEGEKFVRPEEGEGGTADEG